MWVPPEDKDPVVLHAPTRKSIGYFGAVRLGDGRLKYQRSKVFNGETFKTFLQSLLRHRKRGKKILLILDNGRYHHARLVTPWLRLHKNQIELLFLPPYSPDLNPIERLWKLTRRLCTHNQYFEILDDIISSVEKQFEIWEKPNATLKRLCAI